MLVLQQHFKTGSNGNRVIVVLHANKEVRTYCICLLLLLISVQSFGEILR